MISEMDYYIDGVFRKELYQQAKKAERRHLDNHRTLTGKELRKSFDFSNICCDEEIVI